MDLLQIPFSHPCLKVRRVLQLKGLTFETVDIHPLDRSPVQRVSGQGRVPVLIDADRVVVDSTAILLYLEETYPDPPLLPRKLDERAECLLLEDWADAAFMALTRRLAYWKVITSPGELEALFFPRSRGVSRRLKGMGARRAVRRRFGLSESRNRVDEEEARRVAGLAMGRLAGRKYLVGERISLADITLAALSAPLWAASPAVRGDRAVMDLLDWGIEVLGEELVSVYRPTDGESGAGS